jgi:hypothetical protein
MCITCGFFLFGVFFSSFFFGSLGFLRVLRLVWAKVFSLVNFGLLFLLKLVFAGFAVENLGGVVWVVNVKIYYILIRILTAYSYPLDGESDG